jgi:cell division protein FtsA
VICLLEDSRLRFLGCGEAVSAGWAKGRIVDQNAVTASILEAVREAEHQAQVSIEGAVVGVGGPSVRGANSRGVIDFGRPREIEQRDVNRAVERSTRVQMQEDRMVLQLFPQDFVVDDHPGHRDPRKMLGWRLEANVHLITASAQEHASLITAVNQAHLLVEETVFEALAACYAAILADERREGIAVLDIGAQSSQFAVFYGDSLLLGCSLAVCGDHFTRDVARCLHISYEDAALVKQEFGAASAEDTAESSWIELPSPDHRETRRRTLNQILQARAEEMFRHVRREIVRIGMERALISGIVLTGGGSKLPGMCDIAERILECQARKGLVLGVRDWPDEIPGPVWTVAAGLAMYSAKLKEQSEQERQSVGLLGRMLR